MRTPGVKTSGYFTPTSCQIISGRGVPAHSLCMHMFFNLRYECNSDRYNYNNYTIILYYVSI